MLTTNPFDIHPDDGDTLREECGVFGVSGSDSAAALVALGLHALQHRGQEAAGISSFDGALFHTHRAMGHVAGNFDRDDVIRALPGTTAVGHVRYSTTGETALRNVQPLYADLSTGGFAVAHNGNISNAMKLRRELVRRGSIFQSTSDTETIIHLVATSNYRTLLDRFIDALKQVEGAYSLVVMTPEGMIACRDPLGIRPLVMGRLDGAVIFASETVALDVCGATFERQVEPGELVIVQGTDIRSIKPFADVAPRPCIFEWVYFSRPDSIAGDQSVYSVRGTTSLKIVQMMRDAGAAEVHMRIASPPTRHSCFYGVDTPERAKLLAHKLDVGGMTDFIHANSLAFVSIDGLYKALGEEQRAARRPKYCDACFTGDYPTTLTDHDDVADVDQFAMLEERVN